MQHRFSRRARLVVLFILLAAPARAQTPLGASFVLRAPAAPVLAAEPYVAARIDGTFLLTWREIDPGDSSSLKAYAQLFSSAGAPLGPPIRVDDGLRVVGLEATATATGDWAISARTVEAQVNVILHAYGRTLRADAAPSSPAFRVNEGSSLSGFSSIAALSTGSVFQFGQSFKLQARLYDLAGRPRGSTFIIAEGVASPENDVAPLSDGGFVSVWQPAGGSGYESHFRLYDADGQPRTADSFLTYSFSAKQVAGDPSGGFAAVGRTSTNAFAARFDANGQPRGGAFQVSDEVSPWRADADVEYDSLGNLYVLWTTQNSISGPPGPLRARAFDANANPLGPPVDIQAAPVALPARTAHLANDTFVNVWVSDGALWANLVTLCAPGAAVCGDGAVQAQCEGCDAGAGNSDTTPNACRTNCRPAGCGDDVIDAGEECDDGNRYSRDGCDAHCLVEVCGNARRESGEICDDGNAVEGDGCDSNCSATGCRNGVLNAGEECDDGNAFNRDGCDVNCLIELCGNGRSEAGEECDDANSIDGDGCDSNCTITACGNQIVGPVDECDDGNLANGDGCDALCRIEMCGNGRVEGDEGCDDGNVLDDDGCQSDCNSTPQVDAVLAPVRPLKVRLRPGSASVLKHLRLKVLHASVGAVQSVRLEASDGTCPAGTVAAQPDFDRHQAGVQDVVSLSPLESATALMAVELSRGSFSIADRRAPQRCAISIRARASAGTFDITGANNEVPVAIDVADPSAPNGGVSEVMLRALAPQSIVIPPGALGFDRRTRVRLSGSLVAGATLVADDGNCPPGTVSVVRQPNGGTSGQILLRASRAFATTTAVSPARCVATLTAMATGDSEASNDTTPIALDILDRNDF